MPERMETEKNKPKSVQILLLRLLAFYGYLFTRAKLAVEEKVKKNSKGKIQARDSRNLPGTRSRTSRKVVVCGWRRHIRMVAERTEQG